MKTIALLTFALAATAVQANATTIAVPSYTCQTPAANLQIGKPLVNLHVQFGPQGAVTQVWLPSPPDQDWPVHGPAVFQSKYKTATSMFYRWGYEVYKASNLSFDNGPYAPVNAHFTLTTEIQSTGGGMSPYVRAIYGTLKVFKNGNPVTAESYHLNCRKN